MTLPWFLGNPGASSPVWKTSFLLLLVWSLIFTGLSLWHAARRGEKGWFIFFLLVHTAGLMELIYLLFVVRIFSQTKRPKRK